MGFSPARFSRVLYQAGRLGVFGLLGVWATAGGLSADTIYFNDGMKTVCQTKAWKEAQEVKCEYDGGVIAYPVEDVLRIEKSVEEAPVEAETAPAAAPDAAGPGASTGISSTDFVPADGVAFYDPRRAQKYWSSPDARHATYAEAVQALGREFDMPAEQVERTIGRSNDLLEIRRRLASGEVADEQVATAPQAAWGAEVIEFYNPRRSYKYWSSSTDRHTSFREALEALAGEFNRSPEWVEAHMGATNDLAEIRRNLTESLEGKSGTPPAD
jgi:hypothetical protein